MSKAMTKKLRRPDPIKEMIATFDAMTVNELFDARVMVAAEISQLKNAWQNARRRLDTINYSINMKKLNGKLAISDHALIRYLERCKGIDLEVIREEIRALAAGKLDGDTIRFDDGCVAVLYNGQVVRTILDESMRPSHTEK